MMILQLCAFSLLLAGGQMLFKYAAAAAPALSSLKGFVGLAFVPWFWAALVLYGTATLLWISILQKTPLSMAYPFVALGFVIVPLASWFLFREPLTLGYGVGVALIIGGLGVIAASAGH